MEIIVNDHIKTVPDQHSVRDLLTALFPGTPKGIAVAINQMVVTRPEWEVRLLRPQDRITVIKATQGG